MSALLALTVFAGFARTYYLQPFADGPAVTLAGKPFTPLLHAHGVLFTAWVVFFIAQTALVASRRVATHRRMGVAGAMLAAAMVGTGTAVAIAQAARGSGPPGVEPLVFLAVPIFDMVLFSTFVVLAFSKRRDKESHKRLMLLAYFSIVIAATARLPGILGLLPLGPLPAFGVVLIFVIVATMYDLMSRRRIHPVYLWGGALLLVSLPARLWIAETRAWHACAEWLVGRA
jgi:hypothetical protein